MSNCLPGGFAKLPDASWNMCADALLLSPLIAFLEKEDMATRFTSVVSYGVLCSRNIKREFIYLASIIIKLTFLVNCFVLVISVNLLYSFGDAHGNG